MADSTTTTTNTTGYTVTIPDVSQLSADMLDVSKYATMTKEAFGSIGQLITEGVGSYGDIAHVITDGLNTSSATAKATILTQAFGSGSPDSVFLVTEGFFSGVSSGFKPWFAVNSNG
jgi:hypothetical protein